MFFPVDRNSLMQRMLEGEFGAFRRALAGLNVDHSDFRFSRVAVIGSDSAGKSSLFENITKCAVFPRDRNICTKAPVRFKMQTGEDSVVEVEYNGTTFPLPDRDSIHGAVRQVFDAVGTGVSTEEVVVRITAPDAPTISLIDLPGLRTYPPELAQQTYALAEQYLNDPDTLVICVVQATDRLTANNAVALASAKLGEQMRTRAILVLTKPDIVAEGEWEEKVVSRLNGTSPELVDMEFAACVAVISRPQRPNGAETMLLEELHDLEQQWWPCKLSPTLLGQVGVQSLIAQVNTAFSEHIRTSWKPRALRRLECLKDKPQVDLAELGPDPSTLTPHEVVADVCSRLHGLGNAWNFGFVPMPAITAVQAGCDWDWAAEATGVAETVTEWATGLLASPDLLEDVMDVVTAAFGNASALQTNRFADMRDALLAVAQREFAARRPATAGRLDRLVQERLDALCCQETPTLEDLQGVQRGVTRVVTALLYSTVRATAAVDPTLLSLAECPAVRDRRAELEAILRRIDDAIGIITTL